MNPVNCTIRWENISRGKFSILLHFGVPNTQILLIEWAACTYNVKSWFHSGLGARPRSVHWILAPSFSSICTGVDWATSGREGERGREREREREREHNFIAWRSRHNNDTVSWIYQQTLLSAIDDLLWIANQFPTMHTFTCRVLQLVYSWIWCFHIVCMYIVIPKCVW